MSSSVPSGWCSGALTEFTDLKHGFQFRTPDFSDKGVRVVKIGQVIGNGKIDLSTCDYVLPEIYEMRKSFSLKAGDILMSLTGNIGRVGVVPELAEPLLQNYRVGLFESNSDACFKGYLFHLLSSEFVTNQLLDKSNTTAQANFGKSDLDQVVVTFPPFPEQQKIAAILTSVDDVIESTQAQINKLKDLKAGMMQEMLTNGIGHTEFKDSPVGRIPKAWEVKELNEVVDPLKPITYGIVQAGPHFENGVPYIRVSDMIGRELKTDGMLRTSFEIAEKFKRSSVNAGDIVYALRGVIGHVQKVPQCLDGANLTQGTARISSSNLVCTNYLLWALKSPYVAFQNDMEAKGSTFREVTLASLRAINVCVPSIEEQNKISVILDGIQNRIDTIEDKYAHFQSIKKALMQDLLTGKVRVKVN